VLLDILMPDINGLEVLKRVRETHPATTLPIIMVTAKDQSEDIVEALKLGASDYVTKPLDFLVVQARIETQLALKRAVDQISLLKQHLARRNEELHEANKRMKRDLEAASKIQKALLPTTSPAVVRAQFAWAFRPCDELAGDILNVFQLDENHVGLYVLDVVGHGVAPALLSVTVSRLLQPNAFTSSMVRQLGDGMRPPRLVPAAEVAEQLSKFFPDDPGQYFTLLYGILSLDRQEFRFVSAGHPGPVYISRTGVPTLLKAPGLPIGWGESSYEEQVVNLKPGDQLLLYSDGLTDVINEKGEAFGAGNLLRIVEVNRTKEIHDSVACLLREAEKWCGAASPQDDISLLALEITDNAVVERYPPCDSV
jgi:sigma-B regulation protein RsbU (phosphoserine phosphatase)